MRLVFVSALAAIIAASVFVVAPFDLIAREAPVDAGFECTDALITQDAFKALGRRGKATLTSPGWLYVETVPNDASISIADTATIGRGSAFHESTDARYVSIKVSAPGYRTFDGYIELSEKTVRKVRVKMEVMGGNVSVLARPFGSKVRIDGELVGVTPLTITDVKAGAREVAIEAKGCKRPLMIMVEVDGMFVLGEDTCAPRMRDVRPTTPPSPKEEREATVAEPAPAPKPSPAPVAKAEPAPAPTPAPAPKPSPAPVAKAEPAPAATSTAQPQSGKPQCDKICDKFILAVSPASMQGYIRNSCMSRCESGDMEFSICAWKAETMTDVQNCNKIPKK